MAAARKKTSKRKAPVPVPRATKELFVTNFAMVMQRFPACHNGYMSAADGLIVRNFYVRVARFADWSEITFDPDLLSTAFMFVNYPAYFICTALNPFGESLLYRSLSFVAAVFQVVIDCNVNEDDTSDDFLPAATAKNFLFRLFQFTEAFNRYQKMNDSLSKTSKRCCPIEHADVDYLFKQPHT